MITLRDQTMDETKSCPDCGHVRPVTEFRRNKSMPDGYSFYCRSCFRQRDQEGYQRRRRAGGHDLRADRGPTPDGHRYCNWCRTFVPLSYWATNRASSSGLSSYCLPCDRKAKMRSYWRRTYGLTQEDVLELKFGQGGVCALCRERPAKHVDHDHRTGKVRGALCFQCNAALGQFQDRIELLNAAVGYLQGHSSAAATAVNSSPPNPGWPKVIELFPYRADDVEIDVRAHRTSA